MIFRHPFLQHIRNFFNKKFVFLDLTPEETTLYKGLAILMIIMHNFFHWLPPGIGENEQNFHISRVENYLKALGDPAYILQATFSFLGHYGVQVFLFLSAYGLTKKYAAANIRYLSYLKRRIIKIYPPFLFSILIWLVYIALAYGGIPTAVKTLLSNLDSLLYKLTFVANFIPRELYSVNGPWWFVSLIVQFYVIFPYMLSMFKKYGTLFLLFFSLGSLLLTDYLQPYVDFPLAGTILPHIPELSIGIFFASQKEVSLRYGAIVLIAIIFILSNFDAFFWYFSFSSILILILILFQILVVKSNIAVKNMIFFIGSISMYIFYINGFMRQPWIQSAKHYNTWYGNILICMLFILIVIAVSFVMHRTERGVKYALLGEKRYEKAVSVMTVLTIAVSILMLDPLHFWS